MSMDNRPEVAERAKTYAPRKEGASMAGCLLSPVLSKHPEAQASAKEEDIIARGKSALESSSFRVGRYQQEDGAIAALCDTALDPATAQLSIGRVAEDAWRLPRQGAPVLWWAVELLGAEWVVRFRARVQADRTAEKRADGLYHVPRSQHRLTRMGLGAAALRIVEAMMRDSRHSFSFHV